MHTPTAIPTPQPPATPQPPPPRKYTVSPKVLAAARANLAKANAISKEVRYRPTPKRLIACRANLLKALVALKDDQRAWASPVPAGHPHRLATPQPGAGGRVRSPVRRAPGALPACPGPARHG